MAVRFNHPMYISAKCSSTKTVREWSTVGPSRGRFLVNAKAHAVKTGAAMVLRADGSGTLFYVEPSRPTRVRSKKFRDVRLHEPLVLLSDLIRELIT